MMALLLTAFAFAAQANLTIGNGGAQPVRVLVILGGEHHRVESNSKALVEGVRAAGLPLEADFVRIDAPPPGKPDAEKATIASKPDVLKNLTPGEPYDAVIALTQDSYIEKLGSDHVDGLLHYVRSGGGFVGIHSAADTFKAYPEYVSMIGGRFETHPPFGPIRVQRVYASSEVGAGIEDFTIEDEFYHLTDCPAQGKDLVLVGASPGDGKTRPLAWTKGYGSGRVFYTALGHGPGTYKNPSFSKLVRQAIEWAARRRDSAAIFDGRTLDGWCQSGPGRFRVEQGELVSEGGMGLLWYARRPFRDFVLELEWKVARREDNSGVFVRFPAPKTPWSAVEQGYEIQICDAAEPKHETGSVYGFQAPSSVPTLPPGAWNRMRIEVRGNRYEVSVNGKKVNEFEGSRSREGHVGLQNHDADSSVRFRNVRVTEIH